MIDFFTVDLPTAQAVTEAYVATRPAALRRFQERWAASGRAPLAGTLAEADELQQWYHHAVRGDVQAEQSGLPLWFHTTIEVFYAGKPEAHWMTAGRLWLADDVAAAVEHIVSRAVPAAHWVCFTALKSEGDLRRYRPTLVIGDPRWPPDPPPWQRVWYEGNHALRTRGNPRFSPLSWTEQYTGWVDDAWTWWAKQGIDRQEWSNG